MTGLVEAVCVVHADVPVGRRGVEVSGIDKRPVLWPVDVHELGLAGDHSSDTKFHGGIDQAVYVYDDAEARRWASELGREIPPGWFGENLRTSGVAVTDAVVGSRWRVGNVVLEATISRKPCGTFARWAAEPRWVRRFTDRADVGAYFRVLEPGTLQSGDDVSIEHVPAHGLTIRDLFLGSNREGLELLLEQRNLPPKVERDARAALGARAKS